MTDYLKRSFRKHPFAVYSVLLAMLLVSSAVLCIVRAQGNSDPAAQSPVTAVSGLDGAWLGDPDRWQVIGEVAAGRGAFVIHLAEPVPAENLLLKLHITADADGALLGLIIDADGDVLAMDIWGTIAVDANLLNPERIGGFKTGALWLEVPLRQHSNARYLVIQRLKGHIGINGGTLYPAVTTEGEPMTPELAAVAPGWQLPLAEAVAAVLGDGQPVGIDALKGLIARIGTVPTHGASRRTNVQQLVDETAAILLTSREKTRGGDCEQWRDWANAAAGDMSRRQRLQAVAALRNAYAADESDLNALTSDDLKYLVEAINALDPEAGPDVIRDWLASPARLYSCPGPVLAWLLRQAGEFRSQEGNLSTLTPMTARHIADRLLLDIAADRLELEDLLNAVKGCIYANIPDNARQLGLEAWTIAVGTAQWDIVRLRLIAEILADAGLCTPDRSYPEYAAALRQLLGGSDPELESGDPELLAKPLCDSARRRALEAELLAANPPSVGLGLILSWAYRDDHAGLKHWQAEVAKKVSVADGDARADWCIIQGETDITRAADRMLLRRVRWLDRAAKEAATEAGKCKALEARVRHYRQCNRPREGLKHLDLKRAAYSGAHAERLARLRGTLQKEADTRQLETEQKQAFRAEMRAERRNNTLAKAGQ